MGTHSLLRLNCIQSRITIHRIYLFKLIVNHIFYNINQNTLLARQTKAMDIFLPSSVVSVHCRVPLRIHYCLALFSAMERQRRRVLLANAHPRQRLPPENTFHVHMLCILIILLLREHSECRIALFYLHITSIGCILSISEVTVVKRITERGICSAWLFMNVGI